MKNQELLRFIEACKTPYQTVTWVGGLLEKAGYHHLSEREPWSFSAGDRCFVTRNGSSLLAFRVPTPDFAGFQMAAAHCDSPCLKVKEHAEVPGGGYVQLSTEVYGGMIRSSWLDRPLSVAGRVLVQTEAGVETRPVDLDEDLLVIPSVAIHMNRKVNDGVPMNPAVDLLPLYGTEKRKDTFRKRIAAAVGTEENQLLTWDLCVYNRQRGTEWGEFISAPRLDDLQCAYAGLTAFLQAGPSQSVPVYCLFDNEEVGSLTQQGAASTFLPDTLLRISESCGKTASQYRQAVASSFLVSCDNAHAAHPNHPEYADKNHSVLMNRGVVVKYNANQKYTSDAVSSAIFQVVCREAGVPVQLYANRADLPGGSTLGNLLNAQVSLHTVDVGLPQLAMHAAYETAGADDTAYLIRALAVFYEKTLQEKTEGVYRLI
ncbi:MAG: M18 family aminopeptidase [Oscillospiraceae bacterium]|nr:M18 family aminopeptidase [Oscillospiraceae bacterium]